jgi:hypothetical protein
VYYRCESLLVLHIVAEEAEHSPLLDVLDAALPLPDVLETAPLSPSHQTEHRVLGANRGEGVIIGNDSLRMLGTNIGGNAPEFQGRWFIT